MTRTNLSLAAGLTLAGLCAAPTLAAEGYLGDGQGHPVRSGAGMCWRTGAWTPADANAHCDADLLPKPVSAPSAEVAVSPPPAPRPPAAPQLVRHRLEADPLFDFDSSRLRDAGKAKLDALAAHLLATGRIEHIDVTGHTDRLGTHDYNQHLSQRRAAAARDHLVGAGVPAELIHAEGRGESEPLTAADACPGNRRTPSLIACLQADRRVEVDAVVERESH